MKKNKSQNLTNNQSPNISNFTLEFKCNPNKECSYNNSANLGNSFFEFNGTYDLKNRDLAFSKTTIDNFHNSENDIFIDINNFANKNPDAEISNSNLKINDLNLLGGLL